MSPSEKLISEWIHTLGTDPRALRRRLAAYDLGKSGNTRAVEPLMAALQDDDFLVRQLAALALGELHDRRALDPLTRAYQASWGDFQHPHNRELCFWIAIVLAEFDHFDALVNFVATESGYVRTSMIDFLRQHDKDGRVTACVVNALQKDANTTYWLKQLLEGLRAKHR